MFVKLHYAPLPKVGRIKNPNILISKNRVTTADICVAISSYDNESIFPPGEVSELDQTILEVCSDLFPHHVQEFFPNSSSIVFRVKSLSRRISAFLTQMLFNGTFKATFAFTEFAQK